MRLRSGGQEGRQAGREGGGVLGLCWSPQQRLLLLPWGLWLSYKMTPVQVRGCDKG